MRFANDFLNERRCLLGEIKDLIDIYREMMKNNEKFVRVVI